MFPVLRVVAATLFFFQGPASKPQDRGGERGAAGEGEPASVKSKEPVDLDEGAVRSLIGRYRESDLWTLKAIVLVSLGHRWHPSGAGIVYDAIDSKDVRLRAFGLETILRTDPERAPYIATKEIVDTLIRQIQNKNPFYKQKVLDALHRLVPAITKDDLYTWQSWWQSVKPTYAPKPWPGASSRSAEILDSGTAADSFVTRAVDLNQAGLEAVFCIDSTGSMQPTIDAARDALHDILSILGGITPKLRIGLVHYKDMGDFSDGARVLVRLDEPADKAQKRLDTLTAGGGGDVPEAVEKGLEMALSPKELGWTANANKVIVLIGDAPPHDQDLDKAKRLAKDAHDKPFGKDISVYTDVKTKKSANRPFITSAIIVGDLPNTKRAFEEIAEAGGGMCGKLAAGGGGAESIVAHILTLAFGKRFEKEARDFVEVVQSYRKAGVWK